MNFGQAIEALKEGKKVCRSGWNGKGMFICLQEGSEVNGTLMRNEITKAYYGDKTVKINPHIDMKAADDTLVIGWLASQTDMLAEDWEVVEQFYNRIKKLKKDIVNSIITFIVSNDQKYKSIVIILL